MRLLQAGDGSKSEFLQLDYADGDRVFVPIEHVGRLTKHTGESVDLTRLSAAVERRTPYSRYPKPATPASGDAAPASTPQIPPK